MLALTQWARSKPWIDPHQEVASGEYSFLLHRAADTATIARAERLGRLWRQTPHEVLTSLGWVSDPDYTGLLAHHLHVQCIDDPALVSPALQGARRTGFAGRARIGNRTVLLIESLSASPRQIALRLASAQRRGQPVALVSRTTLLQARRRLSSSSMLRRAIWGLVRTNPAASATRPPALWQLLAAVMAMGIVLGGALVAPRAAALATTALLTLPFLCISMVRLAALFQLNDPARQPLVEPPERLPDALLPDYSVLVPLYREANMLPALAAALGRIDYPSTKLDIKIILEADDRETIGVARSLDLPGHFDIVIVPGAQPRTKPKALNYALETARGDFVAVYDAEDLPDPAQLRTALAAFRSGPENIGCVQAALNIHNRDRNWLTRHFALEYTSLFDAQLPSLAHLDLPILLGGTSNHFRRDALTGAGGWDPFNVTEDADLGLRLHRHGWRTAVIGSTTWEEAPERLGVWFRQRTRWLKGWMQTYIVHTRDHHALVMDLGLVRALSVHVLLGGLLLAMMVHPLFYILIAAEISAGTFAGRPASLLGAGFWQMSIVNFLIGFSAPMLLAAIAVRRRGFRRLARHAWTMPLYWLLISLASYRAAWQLVRDPFLWEKTEHGAAGSPRQPH